MSVDLQQAIRNSIQTEKNAMNFYRVGAAYLKDPAAKRTFEVLAREEREHAGHFYSIYTGTDIPSLEAFLDAPDAAEAGWLASMGKSIDENVSEKAALELAMEKERNLESSLREMASKVSDVAVRNIYELNAKETHNHYVMIEAEYARIMGMVHESDMDTFVRE